MKQLLICLFVIICYSCSSKKDEIESIEVMTYYYNLNNDQSKLILDCLFYAKTDKGGSTEILRQMLPSSQDDVGYEYSVDKKLIYEIENKIKTLNEKHFEAKLKQTVMKLYCGPSIRFRIKYKNNKIFSFVTDEYSMRKEGKFQVFNAFYKTVGQNAKTNTFNKVQKKNIKNLQESFERFTIGKDTLRIPFPPMPKKGNTIKFKK